MAKKNTQLQKTEIKSISVLQDMYKGKPVNLILPRVEMGQLPAGTMLAVRSVAINKGDRSHVYATEGGKKALTKYALDMIGNAAGITWISERRIDDRKHPHYCEFEVRGRVVDFDGTVREAYGTKTLDLREDAGGGVPGRQLRAIQAAATRGDRDPSAQIDKAREFMTEMCASKAKNRAISAILGIKRSYDPSDLDKPFIIPKLVPDTTNEMAQQAVIAGMLGATDALFSRPAPQVVDGRVIDQQVEEVTVPEDDAGDDDIPHDPETGEVLDDEMPPPMSDRQDLEPGKVLARLYKHARDNQIALKDWESIVFKTTGKRDYPTLTAEDLDAIGKVVEARIAQASQ